MAKRENLTGKRFGYLTVTSFAYIKNGRRCWNCICDCGNETISPTNLLTTGQKVSCGCYQEYVTKNLGKMRITHNFYRHKLYTTFKNIKSRCFNKNNTSYKNYGGRGITVCDEWIKNPRSFFDWAINNGWKENLTLDRINVNGNYEPNNCRWVSRKVQGNNTRRNCFITYEGKTLTATEWSEQKGWKTHLISWRLRHGWTVEDALTIPPKLGNRFKKNNINYIGGSK